jgi:hypothetical protein
LRNWIQKWRCEPDVNHHQHQHQHLFGEFHIVDRISGGTQKNFLNRVQQDFKELAGPAFVAVLIRLALQNFQKPQTLLVLLLCPPFCSPCSSINEA